MNAQQLGTILADVAAGRLTPDAALDRLRRLPFEDLSFARIDHHRVLRQGQPEAGEYLEGVIYSELTFAYLETWQTDLAARSGDRRPPEPSAEPRRTENGRRALRRAPAPPERRTPRALAPA